MLLTVGSNTMRIRAIRRPIILSDMVNFYRADIGYNLLSIIYSYAFIRESSLATILQQENITEFGSQPYGKLFCWRFKSIRFHNPPDRPNTDLLLPARPRNTVVPYAFDFSGLQHNEN
jgi:hypothetical protein